MLRGAPEVNPVESLGMILGNQETPSAGIRLMDQFDLAHCALTSK